MAFMVRSNWAGVTGSAGAQGTTGVAGVTGSAGVQGVTGIAGVTGSAGVQGTTGVAGATGAAGSNAAGSLTGTTLAATVVTSSLTSVGTLTGGGTGAGFIIALTTSTVTGTLPAANYPALTGDVTTAAGAVATVIKPSVSLTTPIIGNASGTSLSVSATVGSAGVGGIGYLSGAGGATTQATSKATGVTMNKICGTITLSGVTLNANTTATFVFTNSTIGANDLIALNHASAGTAGAYFLTGRAASGSASIDVRNHTSGNLAEAIVLRYAVIKAVVA